MEQEMDATPSTAIGIFESDADAEAAIRALKHNGFDDQQIGIASRTLTRQFENVDVKEQQVAESGAVKGSIIGGGIGVLAGLAGATLIPGVLPILAGSLLVSAIVGGAAGAAGGAFAGPFLALGFSEDDAKVHSRHVDEGRTVVLVLAPERLDEAHRILVENGAYDDSMSTSP
jgi:hypothetical protein